ncbi:MAG TPA: response regulator [Burkholderiales bacterium]|jgi:CheY-like chemotaxis protein|nr:response regulator [Burkholderiales bacterium]
MNDHNAPAMPAATPGTPLRLLLAEDRLVDAELLLSRLKRLGYRVENRRVWSEETFTQALAGFAPELIISDFSMPAFDGRAALGIARRLAPQVPFVFVSGSIEAAQVAAALEAGAAGYLSKNDLGPLATVLQRVLGAPHTN